MSEVDIRLAGVDDGADVALLRRAWGLEEGTPVEDVFEEMFEDWWRREHGQRLTWVAYFGGEPVGMLNVLVFRRMPKPGRLDSRWGYVANVFVLAGFRNRGVGTRLLEACTAYADEQGFVRLVLSPTRRSVPFYERCGFDAASDLMLRPRSEPRI